MTIQEFCSIVGDEHDSRIIEVREASDPDTTISIQYACEFWDKPGRHTTYQLECRSVVENDARTGSAEDVAFYTEHPLLWNHNREHGYLHFTSATRSPFEVLGRLYAHNASVFDGWRSLAEHINCYFIHHPLELASARGGTLASGPLPLLQGYRAALEGCIKTRINPSHHPAGSYRALVFETCFVVCQDVTVREI